ncbi:DUF4828 domain-containing protein [Enterococcus sp. LJL98]
MKKKIFLLTASLATGLIGSMILKKNKQHQKQIQEKQRAFIGDWSYSRRKNDEVLLTITPDYQLLVRGKNQQVTILQQSSQRLVFLDPMGYEISFEERPNGYYFYDEAEGSSYLLTHLNGETC